MLYTMDHRILLHPPPAYCKRQQNLACANLTHGMAEIETPLQSVFLILLKTLPSPNVHQSALDFADGHNTWHRTAACALTSDHVEHSSSTSLTKKHTKLRNHILIKISWIHHLQLIDEYPHIHHNWSVMIVIIYKPCIRKRQFLPAANTLQSRGSIEHN